jgi:hypothetical protein
MTPEKEIQTVGIPSPWAIFCAKVKNLGELTPQIK